MKLTESIHLVGSGAMGLSWAGDCNVYAVESRGEVLLIDCGLSPDPGAILENLRGDGLDPENVRGVLLTHIHPDHVGAVPAFREMGVPILCGELSARILREGSAAYYRLETLPDNGFRRFFAGMPRTEADQILKDGETVKVGDMSIRVHVLPAHSPDSVCYGLERESGLHLFTGDTLFYPGHINYFAGNLSRVECYPQVIRRLAAMAPEGLYPGHAIFTVTRGWKCTDSALEWVEKGTLPPLKPYS